MDPVSLITVSLAALAAAGGRKLAENLYSKLKDRFSDSLIVIKNPSGGKVTIDRNSTSKEDIEKAVTILSPPKVRDENPTPGKDASSS